MFTTKCPISQDAKMDQPQLFLQTYCEYIGYLLFLMLVPNATKASDHNTELGIISVRKEKTDPQTPKIESNSLNVKTTTQNLLKINISSKRKPVFLNADENIKIISEFRKMPINLYSDWFYGKFRNHTMV